MDASVSHNSIILGIGPSILVNDSSARGLEHNIMLNGVLNRELV